MEKSVNCLLTALFFFGLFAFFAPSVNAWDCGGIPKMPEDLAAHVAGVDAVVLGKVIEKKPFQFQMKSAMVDECLGTQSYVRIEVEKSWNRHTPSEIIFIESPKAKSGRNVEVGDDVIVYLDIIYKGTEKQRYQSRIQLHDIEETLTKLEKVEPVYTPEKEISLAWDMKIINLLKFKSTAYLVGFFLLLCTITGLIIRKDVKRAKGGEDHEENR